MPFELAPGAYSVKGTIEFTKVRSDGGLEGRAIAVSQNNILLEKYIQITIVDRATDVVIFRSDHAAITGQQWTASAKTLMSGSCSFECIDWANESETQS